MRVKVKLFGIPAVFVENEAINFSLKKAEGLFYYMVLKRETTRDELINLLWQEQKDEVARKNLRNAIYSVKKAFNFEIFISNNKSTLSINPQVSIDCDVLKFINSQSIDEYKGEFLEGLCIKECDAFEDWLYTKREELKDVYIKRLYNNVEKALKDSDVNNAELFVKRINSIDEFDEKAIRILMQIYYKKGEINRAAELYKNFKEKLFNELGILPDVRTKKVYEKIIQSKSKEQEKFFYGRDFEISKILENYNSFVKDEAYKSILIIGEAGIGKTRLVEEFLNRFEDKCIIIKTLCFAAEESYILKPWGDVLNNLSDHIIKEEVPKSWKNILSSYFPSLAGIFKVDDDLNFETNRYQLLEEIIINLISNIANKNKLLIIFEDIHWMDAISLSILKKLLLNKRSISFLLNSRYDKKINDFYSGILKYERIEKIELLRFSENESKDFLVKALKGINISKDVLENIYKETEGNTFFIVEYINLLKNNLDVTNFNARLNEMLNSRFADLSQMAKKVLNIISMFYDEVPFDYLLKLIDYDEDALFEAIEELISKYIIIEVKDKHLSYRFTHQKLREFIYNNLSYAKKRMLHGKIARLIEDKLTGDKLDFYLYKGLIYHLENSGDIKSALKYNLINICEFLNFSNELFPEVQNDLNVFEGYSNTLLYDKLKEIENTLIEIKEETSEYKWLNSFFCYVRGRFLIWEGEYEKGIEDIKSSIELAREAGDENIELKAIRQFINYGIQVYDVELMTKYVEEGIRIANKQRNKKELAVLFRLKGLNLIMLEKFNRAEEVLKHSLMIFESLNIKENRHHFNIAASLNYLGNIRRLNTDFKSALLYYEKAIDICSKTQTNVGLTVFLTNAGQVSYEMGDYLKAKEYLIKAAQLYKKSDAHWLRAIAEGYLALSLIKEGRYEEALRYLKEADLNSQKLKSPYEKGTVLRVKAEIKKSMENNIKLKKIFENYLTDDLVYYCREGEVLLNKVKERYQVDILKALSRGV